MGNITELRPAGADELQVARARFMYDTLKAERWSLRQLEQRTGIAKSTLAARLNGSSPLMAADIEVFAEVLRRDPVELFSAYLAVGPAGIEPTTSTVESGRLAPVTPIFGLVAS